MPAGVAHTVAPENVKPFVADTPRYRLLSRVARAGAALGADVPPAGLAAGVSRPLIAALHAGRAPRPTLPVEVRREVLAPLLPDIALLEELTGESFADWKGDTGRGDFRSRAGRQHAPRPTDDRPAPRRRLHPMSATDAPTIRRRPGLRRPLGGLAPRSTRSAGPIRTASSPSPACTG